ncbi:hypothetical protein RJT34_11202 [Clitoria ternatea]|uniref:non-specific serine/threonine protein kinase n=1 Tax=Clitoria ternatea TaxID=43366 RepID=A0AAN9JM91_CLITE
MHGDYALNSDGLTLASLLRHLTFVPPIIYSTWNASDSIPCSWVGVQCDHAHHVVSLNLTYHGIFGQLGPQIGKLYHLQTLVLLGNGFSGRVPSELSNCTLLQYLDLSENQFSGQIPPSLKNLQNLQYLSLSSNKLSGGIPKSLFQIAPLEEVSLHSNLLIGPIPTNIGNLTRLLRLYLYGNKLSGTIPSSIGNCSKLEILALSFNSLTGEIPVSVWNIAGLKHILVAGNRLFGELPLEMTKLKLLQNISLSDNQFSGVIPEFLGINSSLVKLDCMNNKFSGSIPSNLCFGRQLRVLSMGINQVQGGIPSDLGKCASLRMLSLYENNLAGSLPDFVSNLSLTSMDISKNSIRGPIPTSLVNCSSLAEINFSMNRFTGPIPSEFEKLVNLEILDLAHNKLEGPLPPQLSNCAKMDHFDVGFNFLNGSLPSSLRSWKGITTLILRENHFTGGIPGFLSEFSTLRELQLGGNLFGGKIPQSLGKLQNLFYGLNLSANGLTGDIPAEMRGLQALQSLDVSLNNLTGSIDVLESLVSLIEVNISYNIFHGPVPKHLMKLLNSSPSSFMGNPLLCVSCSPSDDLSCIKTRHVKACVDKSTNHKSISNFEIVMIEIGCSIFITFMLLTIIRMHMHRSESQSNASNDQWWRQFTFIERGGGRIGFIYAQEVQILDEGRSSTLEDKVLEATGNLNDRYIIGRGAHDYWIGQDYGLILYEYMENGSLHDILHEKQPPPPLTWQVRFNIAIGIAQGLAYLHYDCNPPIVHRDIKPKNILLDANMEAVIADFGTALFMDRSELSSNQSQARLRLSTCVVGTPGYIAPENAYEIDPSRKSDVYSYGVVLLELITRRKVLVPSSLKDGEQVTHLAHWVRSVWMKTGKIEEVADPFLASQLSNSAALARHVTEVLLLALRCTDRNAHERPTIKDVVDILMLLLRIYDMVNDEVDIVATQPYSSFSHLSDVPVVVGIDHHLPGESSRAANLRHRQVTFDVETESEDSNDFSVWQEEADGNGIPLKVYVWDEWKLMYRPASGIAGLAIKLLGNGKIRSEQVMVAALIVPKITYIWPALVFLPAVNGPVLDNLFNWFFLTRLAHHMHLQQSLDSPLKILLPNTNQDHFSISGTWRNRH